MNYQQQVIVSRFKKRKLEEGKERNKWRGTFALLESDKLVEHCPKIQTCGAGNPSQFPIYSGVGTTSIHPQTDYTWWQQNRINSFYKIYVFIFACAGTTCQWEFAVCLRELKSGFCNNLEEWEWAGGRREIQEGGLEAEAWRASILSRGLHCLGVRAILCTPMVNACWCMPEIKPIL